MMRTALVQAVVLAVIGLVCAAAVNTLRQDPFPWSGKRAGAGAPGTGVFPVITLEEAYKRYEEGTISFIDARDMRDFASGHLPGAVNIPLEKAGASLDLLNSPGFTGKDLVIYCSGPDCPLSEELAAKLAAGGVKRGLVILPEGWSGWNGSGFPVDNKGAGS